MPLAENTDRFAGFIRLATFVLIVGVLRFAQDVLVPVALAVLLAFLLSPLVARLVRRGLPKPAAIIATVTIAFGVIGGVAWLVTQQAISLARELPNYEENLHHKIDALKHPRTPETVSRVSGMMENLRRDLQSPPADRAGSSGSDAKPVPVEVKPAEPTPLEIAHNVIGPVLRPLGVAGIVIVFVVAMLFQREDLRDRFIKLVSAGQLNMATQAIDDAAERVSRYLGMQLVVNATYGIPVGVALFFIGIPNALLWGLLATLLRFIPFVGVWVGAAFPIALAIAVDPGWSMALYALGVFVVMEIITANITEIILYGASTGISNLALLIAAVFWTWLWGPAGLVLSTPLTVCVVVLGNYVPGMGFLTMLLGKDPVLEPSAQFYQRMLSMESEGMFDLAVNYVAEHSVEQFYAEVFVPALLLSEADRHSGALPEMRQHFIFESSHELIDELQRQDETARHEGAGAEKTAATPPAPLPVRPTVMILPARDEADELVAAVMVHLLRRRGIGATVNPVATPLGDAFAAFEREHLRAFLVSALPPSAVAAARQVCRHVRDRGPDTPLVVGVWRYGDGITALRDRFREVRAADLVTTLDEAVERLEKIPGVRADIDQPRTAAAVENVDRPNPATRAAS